MDDLSVPDSQTDTTHRKASEMNQRPNRKSVTAHSKIGVMTDERGIMSGDLEFWGEGDQYKVAYAGVPWDATITRSYYGDRTLEQIIDAVKTK